jgi:hypothetical protein
MLLETFRNDCCAHSLGAYRAASSSFIYSDVFQVFGCMQFGSHVNDAKEDSSNVRCESLQRRITLAGFKVQRQ